MIIQQLPFPRSTTEQRGPTLSAHPQVQSTTQSQSLGQAIASCVGAFVLHELMARV
jgi:hypothetical protein